MKLELQILILFLLSIVALVFHHFVPRKMEVDFRGGQWAFANSYAGPESFANSRITDRGAETKMHVANNNGNFTFCAAIFTPQERINLEWFSEISFDGYLEGRDSECFRLYLKNAIPEIYDADRDDSAQYNEAPLKITSQPQKFVLKRPRFNVPSWWAEKHGDNFEYSSPSFNAIENMEIVTGSTAPTGRFILVIDNLELRGHWIPPMVLYRALLAAWMVLATGVVVQKLLDFQRALKLAKEREVRLENKTAALSMLAHNDKLTGLMNRHGIVHYATLVNEAVSHGDKVSLVLMDVDNFKQLNDTRGHKHGDEVLAGIGKLLSTAASEMDIFARWGGEEFIAICLGKDEEQTREFIAEIGVEIAQHLGVTCSMGVYEIRSKDEEFHDSIDRADRAMYAAKTQGKNRAVAWSHIEHSANEEPRETVVSCQT